MSPWEKELDLAIRIASRAGELALQLQDGIEAETKSDESPVTPADRACERLIASFLEEQFPGDGLLGEEGAHLESRNGRRWIIDPIDGTRDYVRGNPLWANLLALEAGGEVVVGVVNLPGLRSTYSAGKDGGAHRNGVRIQPSSKQQFRESVLCFSAFNKVEHVPFPGDFLQWMGQFWAVRGLGGAADAMLVASGQAEVWLEPNAKPWDFAALKIVAGEAGARYFNFDGGSSIYAGNCVICAPACETELRRLLAGGQ